MNAMALTNELGMLFFALQKQSVRLFTHSHNRAVKVVLLNCTVHAFVLAKFFGDNCID